MLMSSLNNNLGLRIMQGQQILLNLNIKCHAFFFLSQNVNKMDNRFIHNIKYSLLKECFMVNKNTSINFMERVPSIIESS